jgi:hypothetical protein
MNAGERPEEDLIRRYRDAVEALNAALGSDRQEEAVQAVAEAVSQLVVRGIDADGLAWSLKLVLPDLDGGHPAVMPSPRAPRGEASG